MNRAVIVPFLVGVLCAKIFTQTARGAEVPPGAPTLAIAPQKSGLVFDAESKEYKAKPGELSAPFVFSLTNVTDKEIIITNVQTSCGCTVAQLPSQPWHLAPGASGEIKATMNLAGKMGHVTKQLTVHSSAGIRALLVNVTVPPPQIAAAENARGDRNKNMQLAKTDHQAVFKGDCRSCHVDQGAGKMGKELYAADCGICHDSKIRAAEVPDLRAPKSPRDQNYWVTWITHGRPGSMMPAFGEKSGGPLSTAQIDSLVQYLMENFPRGTAPVLTPAIAPVPIAPQKPGAGQ